MQTISIREMRKLLTRIEDVLLRKGELHITRRGKPVARLSPLSSPGTIPSHRALRQSMPPMKVSSEELIRTDRDGR